MSGILSSLERLTFRWRVALLRILKLMQFNFHLYVSSSKIFNHRQSSFHLLLTTFNTWRIYRSDTVKSKSFFCKVSPSNKVELWMQQQTTCYSDLAQNFALQIVFN